MKKRKLLNSGVLSSLSNKLTESLDIEVTCNTNQDVDIQLHRAKHEGSVESMNWLICQFFNLIVGIATSDSFIKSVDILLVIITIHLIILKKMT